MVDYTDNFRFDKLCNIHGLCNQATAIIVCYKFRKLQIIASSIRDFNDVLIDWNNLYDAS